MKTISRLIPLLAVLIFGMIGTGCTIVCYRNGDKSFTRIALGTNTDAQKIRAKMDKDGTLTVTVGSLSDNQDKAFGAAAEGITKAIIETAVPIPTH